MSGVAALGTDQEWAYYRQELAAYRREPRRASDLVRLMQVRLALSKLGRVACPKPVSVTVDLASLGPVVLRSHTTDISVLSELVVSDTYRPLLDVIDHPVDTIVDLGANTGLAARWLEHQFPGAQLVCVEPEPGNVATLRKNLAGIQRARVIEACVGGHRRQVALDTSGGEFAVTMVEARSEDLLLTDVITMEDVLDQAALSSIDLLKCDIEGAEAELFANCRSWLSKVRTIVIECHGVYGVDELMADLAMNGADYVVRRRDPNPAFDNEVAILSRADQPPTTGLSPAATTGHR
jgi:FkbM family methyltransferase